MLHPVSNIGWSTLKTREKGIEQYAKSVKNH